MNIVLFQKCQILIRNIDIDNFNLKRVEQSSLWTSLFRFPRLHLTGNLSFCFLDVGIFQSLNFCPKIILSIFKIKNFKPNVTNKLFSILDECKNRYTKASTKHSFLGPKAVDQIKENQSKLPKSAEA
jgi:hypothetical protein